MPFSTSGGVQKVPTHLQWATKNPDKLSKEYQIRQILQNEDWKTLTYVTDEFKCNQKFEDLDKYLEVLKALTAEVKTGLLFKAIITDTSSPETQYYGFDISIEQAPKSKGGVLAKWKKGYCYFGE